MKNILFIILVFSISINFLFPSEILFSLPYGIGFIDDQGNITKVDNIIKIGEYSEGHAPALLIVKNGTKEWGYIDGSGKTVIEPQFREAKPFCDGLAIVMKNHYSYYYIDKTGKQVIDEFFREAYPFKDGIARVWSKKNGNIFINKNGENLFPQHVFSKFNDFSDGLAQCVIREKAKKGFKDTVVFIDKNGTISLKIDGYGIPGPFSEGLSYYSIPGQYKSGYINKTGAFVLKTYKQFWTGRKFCDELAAVQKKDGQKWGYINKSGKLVIPFLFDENTGNFSEGLCCVVRNNMWGVIDKQGKIIVPLIHGSARKSKPFKNGVAFFAEKYFNNDGKLLWDSNIELPEDKDDGKIFHDQDSLYTVKYDDKEAGTDLRGYIDYNGNLKLKGYKGISRFSEGYAAVVPYNKEDPSSYLYAYINKSGKYITKPIFTKANAFSDGMAKVQLKGSDDYGFINTTGKLVLPAKYNFVYEFHCGICRVEIDGKYTYVDKTGKILFEDYDFNKINDFSDGFAFISYKIVDENGKEIYKQGYIDINGKSVFDDLNIRKGGKFSDGLAIVTCTDKKGWNKFKCAIDTSGKIVFKIDDEITNIRNFSEGLASAYHNKTKQYGFIDKTGNWAVKPKFSEISDSFHNGRCCVRDDGDGKYCWGYINKTGRLVIPYIFEGGRSSYGGWFSGRFHNGLAQFKGTYYDRYGRYVWPLEATKSLPPIQIKNTETSTNTPEKENLTSSLKDANIFFQNENYSDAFKIYLKHADSGDASAQFKLGQMYSKGLGIEKNRKKSTKFYGMAVKQNYPPVQNMIGEMLYNGAEGKKPNFSAGVVWFKKAAEQNYPEAMINLALAHIEGKGAIKDKEKASELLDKALLKAQSEELKLRLKSLYKKHFSEKPKISVPEPVSDIEKPDESAPVIAVKTNKQDDTIKCQKCGQVGTGKFCQNCGSKLEKSPLICSNCSNILKPGVKFCDNCGTAVAQKKNTAGVKKRPKKNICRKCSEILKPGAEFCGNCGTVVASEIKQVKNIPTPKQNYKRGLKSYKKKNFNKAYQYFKKSADSENVKALFMLGECYYNGRGVEKSHEKAFTYYKKASVKGSAKAQYSLAWMYSNGESTSVDYSAAAKWYRIAAEKGHSSSQKELGHLYDQGNGVIKNPYKAFKWIKKSALQGDSAAQVITGVKYGCGEGVEQNKTKAVYWYRKAIEKGHPRAMINMALAYFNGRGVKINQAEGKKLLERAYEKASTKKMKKEIENLWKKVLKKDSVNSDKQEYLDYLTKKIPNTGHYETTALTAFANVTGNNYTNDKTFYNALIHTIIPNFSEFKKKIVSIKLKSPRLKEIHKISVLSVRAKYSAYLKMKKGLENNDQNLIIEAKRLLKDAKKYENVWLKKLETIKATYK